jgi:acyl-CoA synthetase (AMP-forming)/AMP-acid ligase II
MNTPAQDQACRDLVAALPENIADQVAAHARRAPDGIALVEHPSGEEITWKALDRAASAFAAKLLASGYRKGDVIATTLPMIKEHVYLLLACYRIGVVLAPLDLRLQAGELQRALEQLQPRGYFYAGAPALLPVLRQVVGRFPSVAHWVQFQKEPGNVLPGAIWVKDFTRDVKRRFLVSLVTGAVRRARARVGRRDPCLVIFTTGSTGSPKPALLCHEGILVQNVGLKVGFDLRAGDRLLVNLPMSHVGGATEILGTSLYAGLTAVLLPFFDAEASLAAIATHRVTVLGQIPALFNLEWNHQRFGQYDLGSLRAAIYGGQAVPRPFLERLRRMAPEIGTGLGLTETSGFCTYTAVGASAEDLAAGVGHDMPQCPISIRAPMSADGTAGPERAPGEIGEVCFSGPQLFLGYLGDEESTRRTISRDGLCYTGDLGTYGPGGLRLVGRSKLTIKPKGFEVFPGDVEDHICARLEGKVEKAAVVGVEHAIWAEAVFAFVEAAPGQTVTAGEVAAACHDVASYARPSHVEVVPHGTLPLNRVAKTDYLALRARAREIVEELRSQGRWDTRARA